MEEWEIMDRQYVQECIEDAAETGIDCLRDAVPELRYIFVAGFACKVYHAVSYKGELFTVDEIFRAILTRFFEKRSEKFPEKKEKEKYEEL